MRTAALGGFSAAARSLSLTPSAISKLVTRLEARLGVRLVNRTTRRLSFTPEGLIYFERAKRIVTEIEETENEVAGFRKRPKGPLRMSVLVVFGRSRLLPALPRFLERNPEIQLDVELSDRRVDLVETGVDLAIRLGDLEDSSLVARKICDVGRVICASPAYLARRGTPRQPEDLLQHNCLWVSSFAALRRWPFTAGRGRKIISVSGNLAAGDGEALLEPACQGLGSSGWPIFWSAPRSSRAGSSRSSPTCTTLRQYRCRRSMPTAGSARRRSRRWSSFYWRVSPAPRGAATSKTKKPLRRSALAPISYPYFVKSRKSNTSISFTLFHASSLVMASVDPDATAVATMIASGARSPYLARISAACTSTPRVTGASCKCGKCSSVSSISSATSCASFLSGATKSSSSTSSEATAETCPSLTASSTLSAARPWAADPSK
ncbi:MAG: LysR family transcriptional regulator [Burkholderiales bacterium]